jgi:hypothetical protein
VVARKGVVVEEWEQRTPRKGAPEDTRIAITSYNTALALLPRTVCQSRECGLSLEVLDAMFSGLQEEIMTKLCAAETV